jgi:guanosine-3',5'-bis(diphosphate) 3'-pyrophosphohydrolase
MAASPVVPVSRYSSRIDAALAMAAAKHAGQCRKGTATPYIVHPVHVAWLLRAHGADEDTVIAGLLHDVLEDTDCTQSEIDAGFGIVVGAIVASCSESDKSRSWEERKREMVGRMRSMSDAAKMVQCADKAHNLHTMADALERKEPGFWGRFKRGPTAQLAYHHEALAALSDGFDHPILEELRAAVRRLEALI